MEKQYTYRVRAAAAAVRSGVLTSDGIQPPIAFSAPPEFQGEPGRWTPEHLFSGCGGWLFCEHFFRDGSILQV